jgi:hypothetical protein
VFTKGLNWLELQRSLSLSNYADRLHAVAIADYFTPASLRFGVTSTNH